MYICIYVNKWHMCLDPYNLDKGGSRESERGTTEQMGLEMTNKGPREEAKGKWERFQEQMGRGKERGQ